MAVADPAFGDAVLPRAAEGSALGRDAKVLHRIHDFVIEIRATVEDQILRSGVIRKGISQLLRDPGAAWVLRDTEVEE